ncbi:phenylalanine--tRNA ligase subunit alpha, partial [Sulfolobus sp. A20-N-F8]
MLSENELKILEFLKSVKKSNSDEIAKRTGLETNSVLSLLELLASKGYVRIERINVEQYELTEEGKKRKEEGLPEDILINILKGKEKSLDEIKELLRDDYNIAISWARRKGLIKIEQGKVIPKFNEYRSKEFEALISLENADKETLALLERRGLII